MEKIFLTAVLSLFFACLSAQNFIREFDLEDTEDLLLLLFDADSLTEKGEALWEPLNFADELSAHVSEDGWVHTRFDTLLYYESYGVERAVAVFETLRYQNGMVSDCDMCGAQISLAIFERNMDNRWAIERFSKHFTTLGVDGFGAEAGLARFGENQWCLTLATSWSGQGIYGEYLTLLNLEDLSRVFNLVVHEDNLGMLGKEPERSFSFDKALHLLPGIETESGWWEFDLVTQGTQLDNDVDRAVPANTVERYAFNWETGTYMKVCR